MTRSLVRGGAVALLVLGCLAAPALAQDAFMAERIERLQRDLQDLQRFVYRGGGPGQAQPGQPQPGAPPAAGDNARFAQIEVRLSQFDSELRNLTGQVERLNHDVGQMSRRLEKLVADVDLRLKELETKVAAAAVRPEPAEEPAPAATTAPADRQRPGPVAAAAPPPSDTAEAPAEGALPEGTPIQRYNYAFALVRRQQLPEAERAFEQFVALHKDDKLAGNAYYWLGQTRFLRKQYDTAAKAFLVAVKDYPKGDKAPEALMRLGITLGAMGDKKNACETLGEVPRRYAQAEPRILEEAKRSQKDLGCG